MNYLKKLPCFIFLVINFMVYSEQLPKLFNLNWGSSFDEVESSFIKKYSSVEKLKYYSIFESRNESIDLRSQASIKYYAENIKYHDVPSKIVFTFYNPDFKKSKLQLSKIEIFMNRKDEDKIWIDTKAIFKDILKNFIDMYLVNIDSASEIKIYKIYEYQVSINSIYTHFIANVGNNILENDTSIYISYESNNIQNLILKKEKDLLDIY